MSAIVLFSGGVDSTTAACLAAHDGHKKVLLLSADYGSLHGGAERNAAFRIVDKLVDIYPQTEWEYRIVLLPDIFAGGHSSLMGDLEIPDAKYQDLETEGPSSTVVPFRNANLISVATTLAEKEGYDSVYIAAHASDANHWAYPDCSPEFMGGMSAAVYVGTMHKVRLIVPFQWMTKTQVALMGGELDAPLYLTWSCYRGGLVHCGRCPTCLERHQAFVSAFGYDPTAYETDPDERKE